MARDIVNGDWRSFLETEPVYHEEGVLRGIVIATAPVDIMERERLLDAFVPTIRDWATCDTTCSSLRLRDGEGDEAWRYLSSLMASGDEFAMRFSVVSRMTLFKDAERSAMLLEDLATHDNPGYYYRMGAAWAVSAIYVSHPDLATGLLESGRLEPWTHNMSIRKICESRRVTDSDRGRVRALRRSAP